MTFPAITAPSPLTAHVPQPARDGPRDHDTITVDHSGAAPAQWFPRPQHHCWLRAGAAPLHVSGWQLKG